MRRQQTCWRWGDRQDQKLRIMEDRSGVVIQVCHKLPTSSHPFARPREEQCITWLLKGGMQIITEEACQQKY